MLKADRAVVVCKRYIILDCLIFLRWAWFTVVHANFVSIMRCLSHFWKFDQHRMLTQQHFTLLNCWRSMSCFAYHITELRLLHRFDKGRVRSSCVLLWTLILKLFYSLKLAAFLAPLGYIIFVKPCPLEFSILTTRRL